ncbi:MAG: peptidoglycan DD-metalloendopeptidase family protein [Anaerolineaceae bacterium]|nr:peptidoglycan DD-metalloendopeptidase family protein [Anaerolineaceae bacterium]
MSALSIQWPSAARPASITTPFDPKTGIVGIHAPQDTTIFAGADGMVEAAGDGYVQVTSESYTLTYANLKTVTVQGGQSVAAGDALGTCAGPELRLTLYQTLDPTEMLVEPDDKETKETGTIEKPEAVYVVPNVRSELNVRTAPDSSVPNVVGTVTPLDTLESLEDADTTAAKLGKKDQWLKVRNLTGTIEGFTAAWLLVPYTGPIPPEIPKLPETGITGMNLDFYNERGNPGPALMKGIGWVRVKFNVSLDPTKPHEDGDPHHRYGNTDIEGKFNYYKQQLQPYVDAGMKVLMVFTHQLYGEAARKPDGGFKYNFAGMYNEPKAWDEFIPIYADFAKRSAKLFAGTGLVHAYQIWNEQDTAPEHARAAVPIKATDYGRMLAQTIQAIREVDKTTPIITGGHVGGPVSGKAYAEAAIKEMKRAFPQAPLPDGIACHSYGRAGVLDQNAKTFGYGRFGLIDDDVIAYSQVLPGKPIWITEWGVLDQSRPESDKRIAPTDEVTDYAVNFINKLKDKFPGKVTSAMWYAWAHYMDNGYGMVDRDGKPNGDLLKKFAKL